MPSRDFTSEDLFSSRMMSMHSSTHSSQMNTVGPAMSLRTSCWLLPQNEQASVFLNKPPILLILSSPLTSPTLGLRHVPVIPEPALKIRSAPERLFAGPLSRLHLGPNETR